MIKKNKILTGGMASAGHIPVMVVRGVSFVAQDVSNGNLLRALRLALQ